jgi:hypothetical protein
MADDFQGELLALLNGNDEGLSSSNNNGNRQQQHLSRRPSYLHCIAYIASMQQKA